MLLLVHSKNFRANCITYMQFAMAITGVIAYGSFGRVQALMSYYILNSACPSWFILSVCAIVNGFLDVMAFNKLSSCSSDAFLWYFSVLMENEYEFYLFSFIRVFLAKPTFGITPEALPLCRFRLHYRYRS